MASTELLLRIKLSKGLAVQTKD